MPQTAEPKKVAKTLKRNASNASVGSTKRRCLSLESSVDSAAAAPREEKNDHAQQPSEKGKSKGKVVKAKAKAKVGKARTCHAYANAGEQWCVDLSRCVVEAVMLIVESEVRRHHSAASAADLKARTGEAVHKRQTQVDSVFDCMLNSHGGTIINDAQLLTSFCWEFVWSPSQSVAHEGKTIKKWRKMKVILDGIVRAWDPRVRWEQAFRRPGERRRSRRGCGNKCSRALEREGGEKGGGRKCGNKCKYYTS